MGINSGFKGLMLFRVSTAASCCEHCTEQSGTVWIRDVQPADRQVMGLLYLYLYLYHLAGGRACFLYLVCRRVSVAENVRLGCSRHRTSWPKCVMISRIAFILVLLCTAFDEFFRGSLDVILWAAISQSV
jgi:hypothetical protein